MFQWVGCGALVIAGFALLAWLPDAPDPDAQPQLQAVAPSPSGQVVEGRAPAVLPVGLQGAATRP
jgi:hypothetical protein